MKKITAFITLVFLTLSCLQAQDKQQVKNLTAFAKVWVFLKYYHSEVAKGNPDWDKELFRLLPEMKSAADDKAFAKSITNWYSSLPKAKLADQLTTLQSDTIARVFDEKEIKQFGIPPNLEKEFTRLYLYHIPDSNKFFSNVYKGHNLDYIYHIENPYSIPAYPDEAHRLLALFRYWSIINYFYPHKKLNAPHWDDVLPEFIPRFIAAANADEYRSTFLMLTTRLKDSHSFFSQQEWNSAHNKFNPPFTIYYIDGKYVIGETRYDTLMQQQDFKVGDEIVSINNKPISDREKELIPYTTGTNQLSFYRNIGNKLFKIDTNRTMPVGILRQGKLMERTIHLYTWTELNKYSKDHPAKLWQNLGNGVWYVRICDIEKPDTLKKLFTGIHNAKTVIWDMRAYPSFPVMQVITPGLFEKRPTSTISFNSLLFYPGAFGVHTEFSISNLDALKIPRYEGRMIVLVNEHTQSLAESVAYELRFRPNTIIMGRQTAGTTGNILFVDYPGGIEASFTGVRVEGLNGSFTEGKGVKIDKEIKLSPEKLTKYPDYVLEMAYEEAVNNKL